VQDFDPGVQRAINRIQPLEMTQLVMDTARANGFHSISVDLIDGFLCNDRLRQGRRERGGTDAQLARRDVFSDNQRLHCARFRLFETFFAPHGLPRW
jgi:hypothetical protein